MKQLVTFLLFISGVPSVQNKTSDQHTIRGTGSTYLLDHHDHPAKGSPVFFAGNDDISYSGKAQRITAETVTEGKAIGGGKEAYRNSSASDDKRHATSGVSPQTSAGLKHVANSTALPDTIKPGRIATVDLSTVKDGNYAANAVPGFKNPAGAKKGNAWYAATANGLIIETTTAARNMEVECSFPVGIVYLRRQADGKAIAFSYKRNGEGGAGRFVAGFVSNIEKPQLSGALDLDINRKLPGYPNGKFTFGCSDHEYYAKYNGIEFFRAKQNLILGKGTAGIRGFEAGNSVNNFKVTILADPNKADLDAKILRAEKLGFKDGFVTGSMKAGTKVITLASDADAAKVSVNDLLFIEIGGEAPFNGKTGTQAGKPGVGGTWPNEGVPTVGDLKRYTASNFTWVHADGKTYEKYADGWFEKAHPSDVYQQFAKPLGLRVRVLHKAGKTLTVDSAAKVSTTSAKIVFDNEEVWNNAFGFTPQVATEGITLQFPANKTFYFGEYLHTRKRPRFSVIGNNTVFRAPRGGPVMSWNVTFCDYFKTRGIILEGNVWKAEGYGMRAYPRKMEGNQVQPHMDLGSGGLAIGNSVGHDIEIKVRNTFTAGLVMSNVKNGKAVLWYEHETGVQRYNAWCGVTTDGSEDNYTIVHFKSPTIFGAAESFGGARNRWEYYTVNGRASSNTSETMIIENFSQVFTKGSLPPWMDKSDPSDNFNQNTGRSIAKFGGHIKKGTIHFEDYLDDLGNYKKGIVIQEGYNNATIENVTVTYAKPYKPGAQIGCIGIQSDGLKTTVRNCKVFGGAHPGHPRNNANISIKDGLLENCDADRIYIKAGVIRNCRAKTIFHGPNVVFEGKNTGQRVLVNYD